MSRDNVWPAFKITAMNGVDVMSCNLEIAYLNVMCRKNIWFEGRTKCGEEKGKVLIFVRALYGLKSAGSSWRAALAQVLKDFDFVSSLDEMDESIKEAVHEDDFKYYEILFVYVDDYLALLHKATDVIKEIMAFYRAKETRCKYNEGTNYGRS